jgi:OOP family OmpA-OmpF porin
MKLVRTSGLLGLVACAAITGSPAAAQDPGWYLGAGIGRSRSRIDDARITSGLEGAGIATTGIDDRNRDTGWKVFTGYQFNRYFALEGGYFDLGRFGFTATTLPPGTLNGSITLRGLDFDAVGFVPITAKFSAFGRAGLAYAEARDAFSGSGFVGVVSPQASRDQTNYTFGAGLQYDITRCLAARTEVQRYRVNDAVGNRGDIDLYSLGLLVRFGRKAPVMIAAAAPAVVAPAPAPAPAVAAAPVLVVVPVPPATQQYCTILDIQFNIDKGDLQPEDKEKLKVLGTFLARYPDTPAVIEGHSDNVGAADHNIKLSQQRAQSVVAYLVTNLHIDPSRLSAVGYGDTRPVADNATEEGKRQNRRVDAVIACVTDVEGLAVVPARLTMALYIDFDRNQAGIKPEYDGQLRKVASLLKANPAISATVEGHTGNLQATAAEAMEISRKRAQNVVDYLVDTLGIERSRLTAQGFGDNRRFAYNTSAEGEQENRRVNVIFTYPK